MAVEWFESAAYLNQLSNFVPQCSACLLIIKRIPKEIAREAEETITTYTFLPNLFLNLGLSGIMQYKVYLFKVNVRFTVVVLPLISQENNWLETLYTA